jgi:predicted dehydrogenase
MTTPLATAVVGSGPWAEHGHVRLVVQSRDLNLAGIWSRNHVTAAAVARRHGGRTFATFAAALAACDAVTFAVPPQSQPELAAEAARAGKQLFLEKPLAHGLAPAEELVREVARACVPTFVMMSYRLGPGWQQFTRDLQRARPLQALVVSATVPYMQRCPDDPRAAPEGLARDVGPHMVDVALAVLGPVEHVEESVVASDHVHVVLRHSGGTTSRLSAHCSSSYRAHALTVEAVGAAAVVDGDLSSALYPASLAAAASKFAAATTRAHDFDAERALSVQRVIEDAISSGWADPGGAGTSGR